MTTQLKFKSWDPLNRIMHGPYNIGDAFFNYKDNRESLLIQNTGLKDKLGLDIYQGDILEFDSEEWGSNVGNRFIVVWDSKNACWNTGGGTNSECCQFKTIIGNIYQNPELV